MKTRKMKNTVIATAILLLTTSVAFSQNGEGRMMRQHRQLNQTEGCIAERPMMNYLDLTEDQQLKLDGLRTMHLKEVNVIHSELKIKIAELDALKINDNPNLKSINAKIDEIGALKTKLQKAKAAHQLEVRAQLTDEQKVKFDSRRGNKGNRNGFRGQGRGQGNGMRDGGCYRNR